MIQQFEDRHAGGRALATKLAGLKDRADTIVLALPRGGVPVAFEVARELNAPLDVFLVRKLGVPGQEELAFGAIASGSVTVFNEPLIRALFLPASLLERTIAREQAELERRERLYRASRPALELKDKICIVVDDGLATGATMRAAIAAIRRSHPKQIIAAAPVASRDTCREVCQKAEDLCVCAMTPEPFYGVGAWYRNFDQTSDEEVVELLELAAAKNEVIQRT